MSLQTEFEACQRERVHALTVIRVFVIVAVVLAPLSLPVSVDRPQLMASTLLVIALVIPLAFGLLRGKLVVLRPVGALGALAVAAIVVALGDVMVALAVGAAVATTGVAVSAVVYHTVVAGNAPWRVLVTLIWGGAVTVLTVSTGIALSYGAIETYRRPTADQIIPYAIVPVGVGIAILIVILRHRRSPTRARIWISMPLMALTIAGLLACIGALAAGTWFNTLACYVVGVALADAITVHAWRRRWTARLPRDVVAATPGTLEFDQLASSFAASVDDSGTTTTPKE